MFGQFNSPETCLLYVCVTVFCEEYVYLCVCVCVWSLCFYRVFIVYLLDKMFVFEVRINIMIFIYVCDISISVYGSKITITIMLVFGTTW